MCSAKGGVGKSVFAANFALALLREMDRPVMLVDLDLGFTGNAWQALGMKEPPRALSELVPLIDSLNPSLLKSYLRPHETGLGVVTGYHTLEQASGLTPPLVGRLLDLLCQTYEILVVDLSTGFGPHNLACLERTNGILFMLTPDLLAINHTLKGLALLQQMAFPRQMIHMVLNRFQPRGGLPAEVVATKLGRNLFGVMPEDEGYFIDALVRETPAIMNQPRNQISRALDEMATSIWEQDLSRPELKLTPLGVYQTVGGGALAVPGIVAGVEAPPAPSRTPTASGKRPLVKRDPAEEKVMLRVHERLLEEMDLTDVDLLDPGVDPEKVTRLRNETKRVVDRLLDEEGDQISDRAQRQRISVEVLDMALGLGPLETLLADDSITEIMCNGPFQIYVERKGKIQLSDVSFLSDKHLRGAIERIVAPLGRRIDEMSPMVDARLRDGSRVNAVIPPLAVDGALLTIRKFSKIPLTVKDLVNFGSINDQLAELFRCCVQSRLNILISGGTGSGKTTLLNVMSSFIPENERIVTIEDSAELQLGQPHICRLETRPPSLEGTGEVTIRDLVKNSLRMRPDRIVVGECRGAEAVDMLQAMNTGHDGSMTTVHANSPRDALGRLETLVMFAGLDLPSRAIREQVASAINLIVQQSRLPDGTRKVVHISEVTGMEADVITLQDIFYFRQTGFDEQGKVQGQFVASGFIPSFMSVLEEKGFTVPREIFMESY